MKQRENFKKFLFAAVALVFVGCSHKSEIAYYMPSQKIAAETSKKTEVGLFESSTYLASDKIWYKKDGLFLPYSRSFLAKTPKEYLTAAIESSGVDGRIFVKALDAYQLYEDLGSSYILSVAIEAQSPSGQKKYKLFNIKKDGLGTGPSEAVKGFESATSELIIKIKTEFGGKK